MPNAMEESSRFSVVVAGLLSGPRLIVAVALGAVAPNATAKEETTMSKLTLATLGLTALLGLAACGSSPTDRALSGAGIGAGTGAVGGALVGSPVTGAVLGGAAGAVIGGLTDKDDINLGDPIWD